MNSHLTKTLGRRPSLATVRTARNKAERKKLETTNGELTTRNEAMASENSELNLLNSDLTNLQNSAKLVIIVLGRDLTIRRFSTQAEKQLGLRDRDRGRENWRDPPPAPRGRPRDLDQGSYQECPRM
jgi:hypothetical protein